MRASPTRYESFAPWSNAAQSEVRHRQARQIGRGTALRTHVLVRTLGHTLLLVDSTRRARMPESQIRLIALLRRRESSTILPRPEIVLSGHAVR